MNQPESPVLRWAGKLGAFFGLSIVWIVCCLPVLTIMPACIALYDSVVCCVHGDEPNPVRYFFATLKDELLRGIGLTVLWACVWAVFVLGFGIVDQIVRQTPAFTVYYMVYAGSMLIPLAMMLWVIPLYCRFGYGVFELHRTAMSYVIMHLPTTAAVLGLLVLGALLMLVAPPFWLLLPAIIVTLQSALTEKVLSQYDVE